MNNIRVRQSDRVPRPVHQDEDQQRVSQSWVEARIRTYYLKRDLAATIVALARRAGLEYGPKRK